MSSETTADIGESSKDSAIVSVERPKLHPDMSRPTTITSLPSTSQETDISNMSSLASQEIVPRKSIKPDEADQSSTSCEEEKEKEETYMEKIKSWLGFIKTFVESIFISATSSLNSLSRDYRFVAKRLSIEKKCLKKVIEIEELKGTTHDFITDQEWRKDVLAKLSKCSEEELEHIAKSDASEALTAWDHVDKVSTDGSVESSRFIRFELIGLLFSS